MAPAGLARDAFEAMQETPFLFLSTDDFSCVDEPGPSDAPLLLMNHWIQRIAPDRTDAHGQRPRRAGRAGQGLRARAGPALNYLAVNFYSIGDVVEAAAVLNGVAE